MRPSNPAAGAKKPGNKISSNVVTADKTEQTAAVR
jgi:hypothetical protein